MASNTADGVEAGLQEVKGAQERGIVTRSEHLQWCKDRANELIDAGRIEEAFTSFASDVGKHSGTDGCRKLVADLGMPMLLGGMLNTADEMRKFINGFR